MHRIATLLGAAVAAVLFVGPGCGSDAPATGNVQGGPPERIVSLSATATETLFAIGAGGQVVAVDEFSDHPAEAPRTKLSGATPNAEAIARLRPDLVVLESDANSAAAALERLKIQVLVQPPPATLAEAYGQIERLGEASGHPRRARALARRMRERIAQIAASLSRGRERLSVFHEVGPDGYSLTSKTFVGDLYRRLGLRNVADGAPGGSAYPQLSPEHVIRANPELIVLADTTCCGQTAETVAKRPGWRDLAAVREGRVVEVPDAVGSRWGPRLVALAEAVARGIRDARR